MTDKLPPPIEEIRTDLWPTMTLQQLIQQQDLMLTRLTMMRDMMGPGTQRQILGIYKALEHGYQTLTALIDSKTTQK